MTDKTHSEDTLSRADAADYLQSLAMGLSDEPGSWTVPIGNKTVETHPAPELTVEATLDERSRLLGDDVTELTIRLSWTETGEAKDLGESDDVGESGEGGGR